MKSNKIVSQFLDQFPKLIKTEKRNDVVKVQVIKELQQCSTFYSED